MKIFFTLAIYCLCLVSVYGQKSQIANGVYVFEKVELTIRNDATKEVVEHKTITDTASIDPYNFHLENTFLAIKLSGGYLAEITLSDGQKYILDDMMALQLAKNDEKEFQPEPEIKKMHTRAGRTLPPYDLKVEGEKLIVTFSRYPFGQSDCNFTMEAELIVTMTKQKDDETNNI